MLCKTGSTILAQELMDNIAQSATPQQSIKAKAFTVLTIGYSYINIATNIEITTIMECQISRVIHMTIAAIFDNGN